MDNKNIENYKHYGLEQQRIVWLEELSELQKELCKWARNGSCSDLLRTNILSEVADVEVCLEQLKYALGLTPEEVKDMRKFKVNRQVERIKEGK